MENNPYNQSPVTLSEELDQMIIHQDASRGERFANLLIDGIALYVIRIPVLIPIVRMSPELFLDTSYFSEGWFIEILIGMFLSVLYYTVLEATNGGRTLGKLVTGTMAIRMDNQPLTFSDALKRSLVRQIPFEALSGFGTPWHDAWTETQVVKKK